MAQASPQVDELPFIDEHAVDVAASSGAVWDAILETMAASLSGPLALPFSRLLGCEPAGVSGLEHPEAGSTVPGFRVVVAERPDLLVVAGRHRFSRYAIVYRVEPAPGGARCRAESRAAFPGRLYRMAVVTTGGHVVATRRLLNEIRRRAERKSATA